ncbi:head maturation protease, ClpP-related [Sulfitobacter sp. TB366]|uniref:head maturation protease, ClpP-related n=1 Tax=Sulfitobacter sp. TB366 TaxID=3368580 RepID=UPI0037469035
MGKRNLPKANITTRPGVRSDIAADALARWSPDVRAAADDGATISILDPIGADMWGDGATAKRISAALRAIGDRPVTVNVNSPGGDYFEGLAIYNLLREHSAAVTINIVGLAASAASVIAMAGDEVRIGRAGFLMIHNAWVMAAGDRHAFAEVAEWLAPFDAVAVDIYHARTGLDRADLAAMLDAETFIGGEKAIAMGFADALLSADAVAVDPEGSAPAARAEKKFDIMARSMGLTNSARRELLADLKGGKPGAAADEGKPGAADIENGLKDLLARVKSL